jgi:hypothetical protein
MYIYNRNFKDDEWARKALLPLGGDQRMAMAWLSDFFHKYGDPAPNGEEIRMSLSDKRDAWVSYSRKNLTNFNFKIFGYYTYFKLYYADEMKKLKQGYITIKRFYELWNGLYPQYLLRPWISIPGKCEICYLIDTLRRNSNDSKVREALKQCHLMHRGGLFMLERDSYTKRRLHALRNPTTVFSCIIDGMDQSHSRMPYLGSQNSFTNSLKQHIQGVLVHGVGITNYFKSNYHNSIKCL